MAINKIKSKILHCRHCLLILILASAVSCSREKITGTQDDPDINVPPQVPTGLTVFSAHDGAAGIAWTSGSGSNIAGYNIYRSVNNSSYLTKYSYTTETNFIDYPLGYDTTYYYAVSSVNQLGAESERTSIVLAKPYNRDAPASIYDISINGRNTGDSTYIHLEWTPQQDYDIKGYEIYRAAYSEVEINSANLIGFSPSPYFDDTSIEVLKKYYYKVISVDKGDLKSDYSTVASDLVLDNPVLVYPANNATVKNLSTLQFRTSANAAAYRIIIQSNQVYGTIAEFVIHSDLVNQVVTFTFDSYILTSYRKYFWRVIAYSNASTEPNSYSTLNSFTYVVE